MPSLPTVEIHSWKDMTQKWVINKDDFDPEKHTKWGEGVVTQAIVETVSRHEEPVHHAEEKHRLTPSVPDFVTDDNGQVLTVNIISPEQRTARKEIPANEYDPDRHDLWSTHTRFHN